MNAGESRRPAPVTAKVWRHPMYAVIKARREAAQGPSQRRHRDRSSCTRYDGTVTFHAAPGRGRRRQVPLRQRVGQGRSRRSRWGRRRATRSSIFKYRPKTGYAQAAGTSPDVHPGGDRRSPCQAGPRRREEAAEPVERQPKARAARRPRTGRGGARWRPVPRMGGVLVSPIRSAPGRSLWHTRRAEARPGNGRDSRRSASG